MKRLKLVLPRTACVLVMSILISFVFTGSATKTAEASTFYIDCSKGDDSKEGTSPESAWLTTNHVNSIQLSAGDAILLRRGTHCTGKLSPKGSGKSGKPISLSSYGIGKLPAIASPDSDAVVQLFNQEYWQISNLEIIGGRKYGIYIGGDRKTLRHFRISDVMVHGLRVSGNTKIKQAGLIAFVASSTGTTFEDIVIDGATCYDSTQWSGIFVGGLFSGLDHDDGEFRSAVNVLVKNSVIHDVAGDGIVLFGVHHGRISHNVTWNTGMADFQDDKTQNANAMWGWRCMDCIIEHNEAFWADTPGVDGGLYSIDFGCKDNLVEYNYGHDSLGYCLGILGGVYQVTSNSVVRYNLCINNGRSPRLAKRQGDIFVATWAGGRISGIQIYNNTIYWNPAVNAPALRVEGLMPGSEETDLQFFGKQSNFFRNNFLFSRVPNMILVRGDLELNHNTYWYSGNGRPIWNWRGNEISEFDAYRKSSGQDADSQYNDPDLYWSLTGEGFAARNPKNLMDRANSITDHISKDIFGQSIPMGKAIDIGAAEIQRVPPENSGTKSFITDLDLSTLDGNKVSIRPKSGSLHLISFINTPKGDSGVQVDSRTQVIFLQSLITQYKDLGVRASVIVPSSDMNQSSVANLPYDWALGEISVLLDDGTMAKSLNIGIRPTTLLVGSNGEILGRWNGFVSAPALGLTVRSLLGPPAGAPMLLWTDEQKKVLP